MLEKQDVPIFNIVASDYYSFRDGGNFFVQANFQADKKDEAVDAVKTEIEKICSKKISDGELRKAVKKLKARFAETSETVSDIAETIGYYMTVCDGADQIKDYISVLEKVTADEILEYSKKYLDLSKATVALLLPEDK